MDISPTPLGTHPWGDEATPHEALGGDDGVRALASTFYDVVSETSPVLTAMLPRDTSISRQKLYEFLSGWTGGPPLYWERRGHPALRLRHAPFPIDSHAADEWTRCLTEAMDRIGISGDLHSFLGRELGRAAQNLRNQL